MRIKFVKFFDVKNPKGIKQNDKEIDKQFNSIGVDVYFPNPTNLFFLEVLKRNEKLKMIQIEEKVFFSDKLDNIVMSYFENKFTIHSKICIPTGIGLLIPKDYYVDIRAKSGNFNNGYFSIKGLIDENYTYGMGVQIVLLEKDVPVIIEPNEKFAQILLQKGNFIEYFDEMTLNDWEIHNEVIARRENRKGGFGHSGKFDT